MRRDGREETLKEERTTQRATGRTNMSVGRTARNEAENGTDETETSGGRCAMERKAGIAREGDGNSRARGREEQC